MDRILEQSGSRSLISHLSIVELESVLAIKTRTGEIYEEALQIARRRFRADIARQRLLGGKRSLALREFALGMEALERFSRREPLRNVHECVFGVLALESEPVDPRL